MSTVKRCSLCMQVKPRDAFGVHRGRKDGLQSRCKACRSQVARDWYRENAATQHERTSRNRRRVRAEFKQWKAEYVKTHPCVDCGESDPVVLEFDHVAGAKSFAIAQGVTAGYRMERLLHEVEKCEVRCANCHRRRHASLGEDKPG